MIIRFVGWVLIVQLIISVVYPLVCIGCTVDEFLSDKYGDKWKSDEVNEAEKEIANYFEIKKECYTILQMLRMEKC